MRYRVRSCNQAFFGSALIDRSTDRLIMHAKSIRNLLQGVISARISFLQSFLGIGKGFGIKVPDYKDASATTSYRHGLPVSSLHGGKFVSLTRLPGYGNPCRNDII